MRNNEPSMRSIVVFLIFYILGIITALIFKEEIVGFVIGLIAKQ